MSPEKAVRWLRGLSLLRHRGVVGLLAVDEAHCVSEWGHEFRPEFRLLSKVREALGWELPVICLTATATSEVIDDVIQQVGLQEQQPWQSTFTYADNLMRNNGSLNERVSASQRFEKLLPVSRYIGTVNRPNLVYFIRRKTFPSFSNNDAHICDQDLRSLFVPSEAEITRRKLRIVRQWRIKQLEQQQQQQHQHGAVAVNVDPNNDAILRAAETAISAANAVDGDDTFPRRNPWICGALKGGVTVVYAQTRRDADELASSLSKLSWIEPSLERVETYVAELMNNNKGADANNFANSASVSANLSASSLLPTGVKRDDSTAPKTDISLASESVPAAVRSPPRPNLYSLKRTASGNTFPPRCVPTIDSPLSPPPALPQLRQLRVGVYHAGRDQKSRSQTQDDFTHDRLDVLVATTAFGMGIDKSDIRRIVHFGMPMTLEGYYQQTGRAGRDKGHAECLLLCDESDIETAELIIAHEAKRGTLKEGAVRAKTLLGHMINYCFDSDKQVIMEPSGLAAAEPQRECRRRTLMRYFDDPDAETVQCTGCDVCLSATKN